ncbi:MAG: leucine-rich repeat domain-containing protein [Muribaculaceae bacterium]|nr:leucine-rich repeat domain-containing protein [Muribaculaceae bacterium]
MKLYLKLLFLLALLPQATWAYDFENDNIFYNKLKDGKSVEVTFNHGPSPGPRNYSTDYKGDVVIPASVTHNGKNYMVTAIGNVAFDKCVELRSISIPNTVTTIGTAAFRSTALKQIDLPNSITSIHSEAFYSCSNMEEIVIPSSVAEVGTQLFGACKNMKSITVDRGNPVYDSRDNCNAIIETKTNTLITACMASKIPNSVTSIGNAAFANFHEMLSIDIPSSVTEIGDYAFIECNNIKSVKLPDALARIGKSAFAGCNNLRSVNLPNTLRTIGDNAFYYCDLNEVTLPSTLTAIGDATFGWNQKLKKVTIPSTVTSIGKNAFLNCLGLKTVKCMVNVPDSMSLHEDAFSGVDISKATLEVPKNAVNQYKVSQQWRGFKKISGK